MAVVVSANQLELTRRCLKSLFADREALAGIVLVDNASTDGTADTLAAEFEGLEVIRCAENRGAAWGRNRGIERALALNATYVWTIDNDAEIPAGTAARLAAYMDARPDVGIASAAMLWGDRPERVWAAAGVMDWRLGEPLHPERDSLYSDLRANALGEVGRPEFLCGCNHFTRAAILAQTGLYDERFGTYYEDIDFSMRVRRMGHSLVVLREPSIRHYHRSALGLGSPRKTYYVMRNRFLFMELNAEPAVRARFRREWQAQYWLRFVPGRLLRGDLRTLQAARLALRDYRRRHWHPPPPDL